MLSMAAALSIAAALTVARVLLVLATLAPVFIVIAVKMTIGGDPILMLSCQLVLLNGLGAILFMLVFFMLVLFMLALSINMFFSIMLSFL